MEKTTGAQANMTGARKNFKILKKNGQLLVTEKLNKEDHVNEREMEVFASKLIRGLMRPAYVGKQKMAYTAAEGVPILTFIGSGISLNDFFLIIAQVVEVTKKIDRNGFNINNLVLDYRYVFVNSRTREVSFIYRPLITRNVSQSIFSFFYDIAYYSNIHQGETVFLVTRFVDALRQMRHYVPTDVENILLRVYPKVYRQFQRSKTGQSDMLQNRKWQREELSVPDGEATSLLGGGESAAFPEDEENTSRMYASGGTVFTEDEEKTGLLQDGEEKTGLLREDEYGGTMLLEQETRKYPYIIRIRSYDRAEIDRPVFRIGQKRGAVDYVVSDNPVVSRLHADILTEQGDCYIRDHHSKNGTFVNGTRLEADQRIRLKDGDRFVLANEEFEFRTD
ncbi:MAG: FHA domain-containing protein [Clostridiales bacterium]|nr:FHA domain-containing protein [Clostridiales bacterium]